MEKVLIVDDEENIRKWMNEILAKKGFKVLQASTGMEAMEVIEKNKIDLAFVDIRLPEMDGIDLLYMMKKASPDTEVIIITAYSSYNVAIQSLKHGACDFLRKPFTAKDIETSLRNYHKRVEERKDKSKAGVILLLEDEDLVRKRLTKILEKEGYVVHAAANGQDGIKILKDEKIDLVLTDVKMPKKSGLEVLREVKKVSAETQVIIFTAEGDEHTAIEAMRMGAADFLLKPINLEQMIEAIRKNLNKQVN